MTVLINLTKSELVKIFGDNFSSPDFPQIHFGVSGGHDSMVLAHVLAQIIPSKKLTAVHIRHHLETDEQLWEDTIRGFCQRLQINLVVINGKVNSKNPQGMESSARRKRIEGFFQTRAKYIILATHNNDLAETLLIRFLRSSCGSGSLAVLKPVINYRQNGQSLQVIRPFLKINKREILTYAEKNKITAFDDPANFDNQRARAFIRHQLLPIIQDRYPKFLTSAAKTAEIMAYEQEILKEIAQYGIVDGQIIHNVFILQVFAKQLNQLRLFMRESLDNSDYPHSGLPNLALIKNTINQINKSNSGVQRIPRLSKDENYAPEYFYLIWRKNKIWINQNPQIPNKPSSANPILPIKINWQEGAINIAEGVLRWQIKINNKNPTWQKVINEYQLWIDYRKEGDRFMPYNRHNKHLRKWFNEVCIPKEVRANFPVVRISPKNNLADAEIFAVPEIGINHKFIHEYIKDINIINFNFEHYLFGVFEISNH